MKKLKLVCILTTIGIMVLAGVIVHNPADNSMLGEARLKVLGVAEAAGSWVCSKCGFHIVTKSGNKPSPGSCSRGGSHNWQAGN